jgi:hypothetical protein
MNNPAARDHLATGKDCSEEWDLIAVLAQCRARRDGHPQDGQAGKNFSCH